MKALFSEFSRPLWREGKGEIFPKNSRIARKVVAQTGSLLCRRLAVGMPLLGVGLLCFIATALPTHASISDLTWGANAISLKPPLASPPSTEFLLTNQAKSVSLGQFYLVGGDNRQVMPTECRVAYDRDSLLVVFRCHEDDMTFPAMSQDADWYSLIRSPSEQDSGFPDKVDLFVQPDRKSLRFYQFAVTVDGQKFGCVRRSATNFVETAQTGEDSATGFANRDRRIQDFTAEVTKRTNEWIVLLSIPWKTLGGRPADYFDLLPMRNRWRDGEVSSPVAMEFNERPPVDLFIETSFSGDEPPALRTSLTRLPSGLMRWQKPALLVYPDTNTIQAVWRMQESLKTPTGTNNLAERLYLTQRWLDLLTLEGFNFRSGAGSILTENMDPYNLRRGINSALRKGAIPLACQKLDAYLAKLDRASRQWFADGSPGDILKNEWKPVSKMDSMDVEGKVLVMHCFADGRPMDLHLSLPQSGGVRVYGQNEGYFKPAGLLPLDAVRAGGLDTIQTSEGKILIQESPFEISFVDSSGKPVLRFGPGDLAFRFDGGGKVRAVNIEAQLDADESIYGFGEKYDRFNQHGNVFTLWGMDDWTGNTIGLLSQSYKPVPVFHSSKNFMVFDNSSYRLRADIGKTDTRKWRLTQPGPILDCYFWMGSPERSLQSYTDLTGKPILPPKWAFEPWMGRTGRGWNKPSHNQVAEEEKVVDQFARLDIPHSAIYSEGSGADSAELNAFMAARGIKVLSWFYPVISESEQAKLMPEIKREDLPVLRTEDPWQHVDFTNPNALELFRRWWRHRLTVGVAGSMVDFGDRVTEDAVFHNGKRGDEMHNFYSYDYHRTCNETFREKRGDDFILFGRAAAPGTQKWVAQFAGDHASNFAGLRGVLTGALNLCACGFSTWGSDLGGFLGWPEPAVYMRWTQFGCFSPLMRCHGRTPREPWNYGDAAVTNYKYFAWVRENLLDYIYNSAVEAHESGVPMMRSLAVAFPGALSFATNKDEYMFGSDLLVAPVINEENTRTVHFPQGMWTSLWNGGAVVGPADAVVDAPLNTIPVYLRAGAVMPVRLSQALALGESLSHGHVDAFIVTRPKDGEKMSFINQAGEQGHVDSAPAREGFDLTLTNFPEAECVLVYGADATAVKVDDRALPQLARAEFSSSASGWCNDSQLNRVLVRLPAGSAGEIKLKFLLR